MALILPKGIVVNSPHISADIERIDREPLTSEEIGKLWKVYTTTKRRLVDPTAERLENFFFRLWSSRDRGGRLRGVGKLNGATVARLFAEISDGKSFVPLRSHANRDESGVPGRTLFNKDPGTSSTTTIQSKGSQNSDDHTQPRTSSRPNASMPPPILKKSRGPSSTGPRPTARFVSPHSSEDESAADLSAPTTGNTSAAVTTVPASAPASAPAPNHHDPEETSRVISSTSRRKAHGHVASVAGNRRRPGIPRRPSSQSSTGSESIVKIQQAAMSLESNGSLQSLPLQGTKSQGNAQKSEAQGDNSPNPENKHLTNTVKRNRPHKTKVPKNPTVLAVPKPSIVPTATEQLVSPSQKPGPSTPMPSTENGHCSTPKMGELTEEDERETKIQATVIADISAKKNAKQEDTTSTREPRERPRKDRRSTSDGEPKLVRSMSALHHFQGADGKSSVSLAPTFAAATGTLDFAHGLEETRSSAPQGKGKAKALADIGQSLFAKRSTQSQAQSSGSFITDAHSPASNGTTLSQSKSHLSLLLAKDRARTDDQNAARPQSKDKRRESDKN